MLLFHCVNQLVYATASTGCCWEIELPTNTQLATMHDFALFSQYDAHSSLSRWDGLAGSCDGQLLLRESGPRRCVHTRAQCDSKTLKCVTDWWKARSKSASQLDAVTNLVWISVCATLTHFYLCVRKKIIINISIMTLIWVIQNSPRALTAEQLSYDFKFMCGLRMLLLEFVIQISSTVKIYFLELFPTAVDSV